MYLLNTSAFTLKEFYGANTPAYAILSHTWLDAEDEVSFKDISSGQENLWTQKRGSQKLKSFCAVAKAEGYEWVWDDTCCIDKASSAELSEAINSMFKWYRDSQVCFAYLGDVEDVTELAASRWFSRGWTLQELLAPSKLVFYNANWAVISAREDLVDEIVGITGIDRNALSHGFYTEDFSAAVLMSWVVGRETTREEDLAYCLFGIFGVNMPLLYGEGSRAFYRLQEEILRFREDYTVLVWNRDKLVARTAGSDMRNLDVEHRYAGMFAMSPRFFWSRCFPLIGLDLGSEDQVKTWRQDLDPPKLTARGLRLTLPFISAFTNPGDEALVEGEELAFLYATKRPKGKFVCLVVHRGAEDDNFYHPTPRPLYFLPWQKVDIQYKPIYLLR